MVKILLSVLAALACAFAVYKVIRVNGPGTAENGEAPVPRWTRPSPIAMAYGLAAVALVAAGGIYLWHRFAPESPRSGPIWNDAGLRPGSPAPMAGGAPELDDVDTMIQRLAARLEKDGSDGEGWRMLGWSYFNTGKNAEAVRAYAKAVELLPDRADIRAAYGEAMVAAADDTVTASARAQFDRALKADPNEPRARFYIALQKAQHGDERAALESWIGIANEKPRDQMWSANIRKRISALAAKIGVDISGRLKPLDGDAAPGLSGPTEADVKAADALPPADRNAMIQGMVDRLASRLAANPNDVDGWIKLLRSRVVLGDTERARAEYALARKSFAANATSLERIDAAARELGLAQR